MSSVTHETVLGSTQTRNLFLDDLMELREFLSQRQQELNSETTNILLAGQVSIWSDSSLLSPSLPFMDSWCQIARVVPLCMATIAGFPAHFYCMHTHRTTFAMKQATRMDGSLWMSACSSSLEFSTTDKQTFKQLLLVTWYCLPYSLEAALMA